jgi:hypothetical protein
MIGEAISIVCKFLLNRLANCDKPVPNLAKLTYVGNLKKPL